jgi:hypothetical protein
MCGVPARGRLKRRIGAPREDTHPMNLEMDQYGLVLLGQVYCNCNLAKWTGPSIQAHGPNEDGAQNPRTPYIRLPFAIPSYCRRSSPPSPGFRRRRRRSCCSPPTRRRDGTLLLISSSTFVHAPQKFRPCSLNA